MSDDVTLARIAVGLPVNRFFGANGGINQGIGIVCKCVHCGTLFSSFSHNLADLDYICQGDCGRIWQHE